MQYHDRISSKCVEIDGFKWQKSNRVLVWCNGQGQDQNQSETSKGLHEIVEDNR